MTRLKIRLNDVNAQRLDELSRPAETASQTVARLIREKWDRQREDALKPPRKRDWHGRFERLATVREGVDAARQEYFEITGDWPEDTGHEETT